MSDAIVKPISNRSKFKRYIMTSVFEQAAKELLSRRAAELKRQD